MTPPCARCDWTPDDTAPLDGQAAEHARTAGHWLCSACGCSLTEVEPRYACESCLTRSQALLAECVVMYAELPSMLGQPAASSLGRLRGSGDAALPGGDALVLLAGGGTGTAETGATCRDGDPVSVQWSLLTWAQDWSDIRGDGQYPSEGVA